MLLLKCSKNSMEVDLKLLNREITREISQLLPARLTTTDIQNKIGSYGNPTALIVDHTANMDWLCNHRKCDLDKLAIVVTEFPWRFPSFEKLHLYSFFPNQFHNIHIYIGGQST